MKEATAARRGRDCDDRKKLKSGASNDDFNNKNEKKSTNKVMYTKYKFLVGDTVILFNFVSTHFRLQVCCVM